MAHKQCGLWREKETDKPRPKICPKCNSEKLNLKANEWDDEDEIDIECGEAWFAEWEKEGKDVYDEPRFFYFEKAYECRKCGHYDAYGPRRYFNPKTLAYDCDRPLMPDAAKQAQMQHDRQKEIEAGQLTLI